MCARLRSSRTGAIPGSINVPWHDIDGIPAGIDPVKTVLVICASGQRAGTAASLLQHHGATDVIHVVGGGMPKWLAARSFVERLRGTPGVGASLSLWPKSLPPLRTTRSARAKSFGAAASIYDRARPSYPDEAVDWLFPLASHRLSTSAPALASSHG